MTPRVREVLLQHIDENQLLSAALSGLRDRVDELERLVDSDTLTPLPNRRRFKRELARVVEHRRRYGTPACLMFVDIDGLKAINDRHGHLAGDATLIHVADLLRAMLRTTDVVARIGGDEFGLLLEYIDIAAARDKGRLLSEAVAAAPLELGGEQIPLSISIGISELGDEDSAEAFLARADREMYTLRAQRRSER